MAWGLAKQKTKKMNREPEEEDIEEEIIDDCLDKESNLSEEEVSAKEQKPMINQKFRTRMKNSFLDKQTTKQQREFQAKLDVKNA